MRIRCWSGVIANKVIGIRAALKHEVFSAHQGVEDDSMNVLWQGGRTIGTELAADFVRAFLAAKFTGSSRHKRRLDAIKALERNGLWDLKTTRS